MGTYKRNAEHSPTNLANVYTTTDDSDTHFYRSNSGYWYVSKTDDMVVGKSGGWIMSASSSHTPLDLEWKFAESDSLKPDPFLNVNGF